MARDPGSVWAPLPEAGAPDGYVKTQFIVHSTGDNGTAKATARYFGGTTPNESTFIVGHGPHDPTLQIMDSTDRADANMSASVRAISVEVVGDGIGGYNAWQRSEIIRLGRWARAEHPGILPRIIPTHTQPGYGWHVMFGAPGPWAGVAKSCPGKTRIAELKADIFPAIFAGSPLEDDMPTPRELWEHPIETVDGVLSAEVLLRRAYERTGSIPRAVIDGILDAPIDRDDLGRGPTTMRQILRWSDPNTDRVLTSVAAATAAASGADPQAVAEQVRAAVAGELSDLRITVAPADDA